MNCPRCGEPDLVNDAGCYRCGWQEEKLMPRIADELRAIITEFYEHGSPEGARLEALIPRVEALEHAASPVPDEPNDDEYRPREPDGDASP